MKGTFQIVGWKGLFYGGVGGETWSLFTVSLWRLCTLPEAPGGTDSGCAVRAQSSVPRIACAHYPCFVTFSCHFFYPKKIFFKSLKKKKRHIKHANTWTQQANTEMWTLHVDIRAQRQALGNVCVHSLHVRVRACVRVCLCGTVWVSMLLHSQCSLCVRVWERVRDLTVGFPSVQYMLFPSFFGIGQMFSLLLFASNFALRCPCPSVS